VNYPERDQTISPSYWYQFTIDDVYGMIPDAARITRVTTGGNGQDFLSSASFISLLGKQLS
jgi:hypothetical protein